MVSPEGFGEKNPNIDENPPDLLSLLPLGTKTPPAKTGVAQKSKQPMTKAAI
jgi:hypothetical protein